MSGARHIALLARLRHFRRDESGTTLVEMGLAISLTLLIFVVLLDFGRLAFNYVVAEKGVHTAARIAAVRPPVCTGVPEFHVRGTVPQNAERPRFGTACRAASYVCQDLGAVRCRLSGGDPTSEEIWAFVRPRLPNHATMSNVEVIYSPDPNLGFLGGPYSPVVTVEVTELEFEFLTPLGRIISLARGTTYAPTEERFDTIPFPRFSASVPGEDLNSGEAG